MSTFTEQFLTRFVDVPVLRSLEEIVEVVRLVPQRVQRIVEQIIDVFVAQAVEDIFEVSKKCASEALF